jgi:hypothetical protein
MSALLRRIEKLEASHNPDDDLTVFLISWAGNGPITKAMYGRTIDGRSQELTREAGESEDAFNKRVESWVWTLPGHETWRAVWMQRC